MKRPMILQYAAVLFASLLPATGAAAQTALIDTPVFQLNDDGGLVSLSAFGTGVIPATGPGARLMWHPAKAAFRAGEVDGTQWDEANVGDYSVALGQGTTASGTRSTALGNSTTASGLYATAMGEGTTASASRSTAMGVGTEASGIASTALGAFTTASGSNATAMGIDTEASGTRSTALGFNTEASGENATAMGESTQATGDYSTSMGESTQATGDWSVAMGEGTAATGDRATALGLNTIASGNYATTFGRETWASGILATALGRNTVAQAFASLVIGRYNVISGNPTGWSAANPVFVVGNGSGPATADRSNALTLLGSGTLQIAGTLLQNSDRRLKTDIEPLSDVVAGLSRLQPVRFRFREGMNRSEGAHIGLIAQEVQAVFPALVSAGSDGYLSVSYTNLVAVLVQGLNEQQTEIAAQQARMEAQQAQIEAQQNEIDTLKAQQAEIDALKDQQNDIEALRAEIAALRSAVETRPTAVSAEQ